VSSRAKAALGRANCDAMVTGRPAFFRSRTWPTSVLVKVREIGNKQFRGDEVCDAFIPEQAGTKLSENAVSGDNNAEKPHADVDQLSFERAIEELETIVKRLEDGKVPLEESVAIYERGEVLKRRCEHLLRQAEARVEKIALDASGKPKGIDTFDVK
jgi:exodeoxyribonuclease VII small subunit